MTSVIGIGDKLKTDISCKLTPPSTFGFQAALLPAGTLY